MDLARNLTALAASAAAFACAHARAAPPPPATVEITESDFHGRFLAPLHPSAEVPALLVLRSELGDEIARTAAEAGIAALELEGGSAGQALLWLGPRAKRIFVAAEGDAAVIAAELVQTGHVAGLVLIEPPVAPSSCAIPCLVLDHGPAASKQDGRLWELTLPDLKAAGPMAAETSHTVLEAMALWLTSRAREP